MEQNNESRNRIHTYVVSLYTKRCKGNSTEEGYSFQQMMLEQLDIYLQKMNFNLCLAPFIKINSNES